MCAVVLGIGPIALAQEGPIEEIVVTGSHIRGTPEDAALPVDVIDSQELEDRGNPSALDLIRAMPYVGPTMGETNQFGPNQGTIGTGNVNLRGLGGMRTLVLMNGRRTTYTPAEGPAGVDTNLLPLAAIGRVEVLKDGAAATYGSDAIAGVVNFITRKDIDGLELEAGYRDIQDSGSYRWSVNWGWQGERSNVLVSYGYQYRDELKSTDRNWATAPYLDNPTGWSAFGTPGNFLPYSGGPPDDGGTAVASFTRDSNCSALGGYPDGLPAASGGPVCRFTFIPFDNLVEKTRQEQIYGEINTEIADGVELHIEGLWATTKLPQYRTSPSYPPTSGPNGPGAFQFYVVSDPDCPTPFCNNPGALTALQQSSLSSPVVDATDTIRLFFWRPNGWGGVDEITGGNGGQLNVNYNNMARASASLRGTLEGGWLDGIGWDIAVTYSDSEMQRSGVDTRISRLEDALQGLGGDDCNGIAYGLPGSTCLFFNPFSNAIERSAPYPELGANPGYVPANANSVEIQKWMFDRWNITQEQSLLVVDAVLDGEFGGFSLPGGQVGWAFGSQYREIDYQTYPDNPLIDARVTPCPDPGDTSCSFPTGPFIFLGQFIPQQLHQEVYSFFGELHVPILDTLDVQLAVRYEDYGGLTGDTTDPKVSIRWQAVPWLAFRGSAGSTFRGPTPVNLSLQATGLQPVPAAANQYRSIDFSGNPDLKPETADTWSLGFILQAGGFEAIVDYWDYKFKDQITSVPYAAISNAVGNGPGTGTQLANCNHPLRYLVVFDQNDTCTQGVTVGNQMQRISSPVVNGSPVETAGIDMSLTYEFSDSLIRTGILSAGVNATYVDKYDQSAFDFGGVRIFDAYDAVGFTNYERFPGTISKWRGLGYVNYNLDNWNFRWELRYVDGVTDDRGGTAVYNSDGVLTPVTWGEKVKDYYANNLYVNWKGPWETMVGLAVVNIFDEDPPKARLQLGYDPYIGDPLGRTIQLTIKKSFANP